MGDGRVDRGEQFRELVVVGDRRIERLVVAVDGLGVLDLGMRCVRLPCPAPQRLETGGRQRPAGCGAGDAAARRNTACARVSSWVGVRMSMPASCSTRSSMWTSSPSSQSAAAGVGEMGPGDPAIADRARSQPLVEPRQRVFGARKRPRELGPGDQAEGARGRHRKRAFRGENRSRGTSPQSSPAKSATSNES